MGKYLYFGLNFILRVIILVLLFMEMQNYLCFNE